MLSHLPATASLLFPLMNKCLHSSRGLTVVQGEMASYVLPSHLHSPGTAEALDLWPLRRRHLTHRVPCTLCGLALFLFRVHFNPAPVLTPQVLASLLTAVTTEAPQLL